MQLGRRITRLVRRYNAADIPTTATVLAFHTLLGIVPIMAFLFWYLNRIGVVDQWLELVRAFFINQLNLADADEFFPVFKRLTSKSQGKSWGLVGLLLLMYTAWNLMARSGECLDIILGVEVPKERDFRGKFVHVMRRGFVLIGLPLALVLTLAVTHWVRRDSLVRHFLEMDTVGPFFALPLAWSVTIGAFFCVYFFMPSVAVPWKQALKAAAIAGPLTEISRMGFGLYNRHIVLASKMFGVLTSIPIFIFWVQVMWILVLAGALFIRLPPEKGARR